MNAINQISIATFIAILLALILFSCGQEKLMPLVPNTSQEIREVSFTIRSSKTRDPRTRQLVKERIYLCFYDRFDIDRIMNFMISKVNSTEFREPPREEVYRILDISKYDINWFPRQKTQTILFGSGKLYFSYNDGAQIHRYGLNMVGDLSEAEESELLKLLHYKEDSKKYPCEYH